MAQRLFHACRSKVIGRAAALSTCAAATSSCVSWRNEDTRAADRSLRSCPLRPQIPPCSNVAKCHNEAKAPGYLHFQNERLRITEVKLRPGESASMSFEYPHLRWEVLPTGCAQSPEPAFYTAGKSHTLSAEGGRAHREYVFEFLGPPKYTQQQYREKQAVAWYHGYPGTKFMFENEYCAAFDFRVPAKGGDIHDMHQHIVDHCFVLLDLPCSLEVYVPESENELPAADGRVQKVRYYGKLDCPDVSTSWRYFPEMGDGGFVDGKPNLGDAVHGVCNPSSSEFREYYIDLK